MRRLVWSLLIVTMWISAGHAVPVSTGTPVKVVGAIGPNTGSASVTVPSDAQLMVCSVTGFSNTSGYFSGGSLTIAGAAMTVVTGGDANTGLWESALWYKVSPATGSQTLAWDWVGTADADASSSIACAWYKSLDTASPVRSSLCAQSSGSPYATGTMTAQSGDLAVAFVAAFATSADQTFSFVNATAVAQFAIDAAQHNDAALGEGTPSGNVSVSASATGVEDGAICGIIVKPAAAGISSHRMVVY